MPSTGFRRDGSVFIAKELRAWAFYDWANSAFMTTIVAAVFPIYYANVAAAGLPPEAAASSFGMGDHHRAGRQSR